MLIEIDPLDLKKKIGELIQDHKDNSIKLAKEIYSHLDKLTETYQDTQLPTEKDFNYIPEFNSDKESVVQSDEVEEPPKKGRLMVGQCHILNWKGSQCVGCEEYDNCLTMKVKQ